MAPMGLFPHGVTNGSDQNTKCRTFENGAPNAHFSKAKVTAYDGFEMLLYEINLVFVQAAESIIV